MSLKALRVYMVCRVERGIVNVGGIRLSGWNISISHTEQSIGMWLAVCTLVEIQGFGELEFFYSAVEGIGMMVL